MKTHILTGDSYKINSAFFIKVTYESGSSKTITNLEGNSINSKRSITSAVTGGSILTETEYNFLMTIVNSLFFKYLVDKSYLLLSC